MNKEELKNALHKRMLAFGLSYKEAIEEVREFYPKYNDMLDKLLQEVNNE